MESAVIDHNNIKPRVRLRARKSRNLLQMLIYLKNRRTAVIRDAQFISGSINHIGQYWEMYSIGFKLC